jgi:hypothetical protein
MLFIVDTQSFQTHVQSELQAWAGSSPQASALLSSALQQLLGSNGVTASTNVRNQRAFADNFEVFAQAVRNSGCSSRV